MRKANTVFSKTIFLIFVYSSIVSANNWPQWRGPNRDGISQETGLLDRWPAEGPRLLWQIQDLGKGYATPSVSDGILYVMANEGLENEYIKAFDAGTGKACWKVRIGKVGNPDQKPNFPSARSTPTVDDKFVYALGSDGDLVCMKIKSGDVIWQKNLRTDFGGIPGSWAYSESPLIDGNKLICVPGDSITTVIALNKKNGELIWKTTLPSVKAAGYASFMKTRAAGIAQYITLLDSGLFSIHSETGAFLWSFDAMKGIGTQATPVVQNEYVYAASRKGSGVVMIRSEEDHVKVEPLYMKSQLPNAIGGCVLIGEYLYGAGAKNFFCVDFMTGDIKWEQPDLAPGSVCYADDKLYFHGENGDVVMIQATPESCQELGRTSPPNQPVKKDKMEKAWAYPIIANGNLYIRDLDSLWCYKIK